MDNDSENRKINIIPYQHSLFYQLQQFVTHRPIYFWKFFPSKAIRTKLENYRFKLQLGLNLKITDYRCNRSSKNFMASIPTNIISVQQYNSQHMTPNRDIPNPF